MTSDEANELLDVLDSAIQKQNSVPLALAVHITESGRDRLAEAWLAGTCDVDLRSLLQRVGAAGVLGEALRGWASDFETDTRPDFCLNDCRSAYCTPCCEAIRQMMPVLRFSDLLAAIERTRRSE